MTVKRIYLDYAASTPLDPKVKEVVCSSFEKEFGNPGSLHSFGRESLKLVDRSRETVAKSIGADFSEIVFTGSATEANNLALRGTIKQIKSGELGIKEPKLIISAIEHSSVLNTAKDLEKDGVEVVYLPVDKEGFVDLNMLERELDERTALVSVMYANNEIGTIQPISKIAQIIRNFRETNQAKKLKTKNHEKAYPLFHTDAVQAFQYLDCNAEKLGVDLMTLSAHKIYGPKGIGALYVRKTNQAKSYKLKAIITGGGQEFSLRAGTENAPLIAGFAEAVRQVEDNKDEVKNHVWELSEYFWRELKEAFPEAVINGVEDRSSDNSKALPSIYNVRFPGYSSQDMLIKLDMAGIAVSSGSACGARSVKPSHVLMAINMDRDCIKESLRISFGKFTIKNEVDEAIKRIKITL